MADEGLLLARLDDLQISLDNVSRDLKELKSANKLHRVRFWVVGIMFGAMLLLTWFVWDSSRDARSSLALRFEQSQVENCEVSQDGRVRLRSVFQLLFSQAAAGSENPEEVRKFAEEFNAAVLEAVPDRDCGQEAKDRRRLTS